MGELRIFVKRLHSEAKLPSYAHQGPLGDLAADLYSIEDADLLPRSVQAIRTGIAIELPVGYGAIVEDRSGTALKGVTTLAGVIDTGYRGEVRVVLTNIGENVYRVRKGDRIAQMRIVKRLEGEFVEVEDLNATPRFQNGFGSTGA